MADVWTIHDSIDLYKINEWGRDFFSINKDGNVVVQPTASKDRAIDLKTLVADLGTRGISTPVLIRFPDILKSRIDILNQSFQRAIQDHNYRNIYRGVYPIKVNQERLVVEAIVKHGRQYGFGLEAGSKPELMAVLALSNDKEALYICNGYKDEEYIEMALMANKLGRKVVLVLEKISELDLVLQIAKKREVKPILGIRAKLKARGTGRWESSSGDRSKFGLTASEMLQAVEKLKQEGYIESLELLHFHIGSQISNIRNVKNALTEAARFYTALVKHGAPLKYLDVGGGLAIDYDGSQSNYVASMNYSMQEYANDVVFHVMEVCDEAGVAHPVLVSESGRALTAHHSVLVFDVLGVSKAEGHDSLKDLLEHKLTDEDPNALWNLRSLLENVTRKNVLEFYHDAVQLRDEVVTMFNLGFLNLEQRALAERYFWAICRRLLGIVRAMPNCPDELHELERNLAGTYFCNFSLFQSLPDYWAINHQFPILPIHRLNEEPIERGILADITCDSDGKIDDFIGHPDVRTVLELHTLDHRPYHLGIFLVGAYQEILGDLHNLFGDNNAVHVSMDEGGNYVIEEVEQGDSVEEVLRYVSYEKNDLINRLRSAMEEAVRAELITLQDLRNFMQMYREQMDGYTYLEG